MVEVAHLKPHRDARNQYDMDCWAWMMGNAYRETFNIDCRLNLIPLNVYLHRLLDAHLVTFLLDDNILRIVKEKLLANKTATFEQRQRILTDLDQEMPEGGWPVTLIATPKCDRTEAIIIHDLKQNASGELCTAETYKVFKHPFEIPFKTAASPIFILANIREQQKNMGTAKRELHRSWTVEQSNQFVSGARLIRKFVEKVEVPDDFKRRAGRNTRTSDRDKAVLGPPADFYDYQLAKYQDHVAQYDSDDAENEHHTDSEEKHYFDSDEESSLEPVQLLNGYMDAGAATFDERRIEWDRSEDEKGRRLSETGPESSELSSEYVNDETGSELGRRESPLRLRSHTHVS
ncbi:hypothetical protein C0992_007968 [Termitomyces sp. T32_za158]|nr:hypothetical protein C0992_007968 [Termitomyces sp. T32_za158]